MASAEADDPLSAATNTGKWQTMASAEADDVQTMASAEADDPLNAEWLQRTIYHNMRGTIHQHTNSPTHEGDHEQRTTLKEFQNQ